MHFDTEYRGRVFTQGSRLGGSTFARLEGCWYGNDSIYLVATSGGNAKLGQVWQYRPEQETLTLIFESPSADVLDLRTTSRPVRGAGSCFARMAIRRRSVCTA